MPLTGDELYSLLIPLRDERLIVPRACVAEVVRYSPTTAAATDNGWLRDTIAWRDKPVTVVAFEALLGMPLPPAGGRTRAVVFHPLSGNPNALPIAILAQGFPQMVRVNSEAVQPDVSYRIPQGAPVLCRISMLSEFALIPDLEALEARLAAVLAPA